MFQKVHVRLASLCAGITIFILFVMSCGYLYISEQGLRSRSFTSFQNDMNTLVSNLEQQTIITHEWLTRIEDHGKYLINVIDNGIPFLYNERNTPEQKLLFETTMKKHPSLPLLAASGMWNISFHLTADTAIIIMRALRSPNGAAALFRSRFSVPWNRF